MTIATTFRSRSSTRSTPSNHDPFLVCGGAQDNGMWCVKSAVRNRNGISNRDAFSVGGGDGMHVLVDPLDTNYAFFEPTERRRQSGNVQRLSLTSLNRETVKPGMRAADLLLRGDDSAPAVACSRPLRWGWDTPIVFSSVDSQLDVHRGECVIQVH